jgi:hypothetical protein
MISYNTKEVSVSEKNKKKYFLYIGILIIMILGFTTVLLPKDTFLMLVKEDGPFEDAGAFLFFITSVLFFVLFFRKDKFYQIKDREHFSTFSRRIFFLLLGLLFVVLLGEEISWGQRIIGFATPESIEAKNVQNEFNIHNLEFFHLRNEEKIRKTGIEAWFTAKKMFVYVFVMYLFIIPLLVKVSGAIKNLTNRFYLPVPMIELGILFILNILIFKAFKPLSDGTTGMLRGLAEVEEFNFALILFMLPLIWMGMPTKKISLSKIF